MAFIQVPSKDSFGKRFGNTFIPQVVGSLRQGIEDARQNREMDIEDEALRQAGYNVPKGIRNPKIREALLEQQQKSKKSSVDELANQESADAIGKAFGEEAKAIYPHLTEGGKTKLTQALIEGKMRGIDTRQLLGNFIQTNPQDIASDEEQMRPTEQPEIERDRQVPREEVRPKAQKEFPAYKLDTTNMLPKERVSYQKELRGYNDPILKEANTAKKAAEKGLKSYQALAKLSPKIPQGLSRFFYDAGGNIRPLAQVIQAVPPEAEEYVKVINDFTTQAKDSYGSRVTNFDLQQFMRRLPTLANSEKGRELILKRMQETSQADAIFHKTLEDVYRKYGAGNITPEDAFKIAEDVSAKRLSNLQQDTEETDAEMDAIAGNTEQNSQLPDAATHSGKIIKNSETGQRLKSDGSRWIPI